jgi:hypothetical protein
MMLNELCQELRNYFDKAQPKFFGEIVIEDGKITNAEFLEAIKSNQYFRIVGSIFNDGVYCFNEELELEDETFDGAIWLMAVPKAVLEIAKEIEDWQNEYGNALKSPYQSESFGGYSYSKASGKNGGGAVTWQDAFATRLNLYRRIRI